VTALVVERLVKMVLLDNETVRDLGVSSHRDNGCHLLQLMAEPACCCHMCVMRERTSEASVLCASMSTRPMQRGACGDASFVASLSVAVAFVPVVVAFCASLW
jgi:hypothetical protein